MKRTLLLFSAALIACGSAPPPPATISNREASTAPAPSGAGTARVITRMASGGVIQLEGDRTTAMTAAEKEMAAHCGLHSYSITQEGEEAIGTDSGPGIPTTITAWRVHYTCTTIDI